MKGREKQKRTDLKKLNLKNKNAITLIALVVTIVVLLILAGVSINLILDNNGIIAKAKDARKEYGQAKINEQAELDNASYFIDDATGANEPKIVEPENIADWEYVEENGTITIKGYSGTDTKVIIPNYINGMPVKKIESGHSDGNGFGHLYSIWSENVCSEKMIYWYMQKTIKEVVISEGVETIGRYAFMFSQALEKVTIPSSVSKIDNYAFGSCEKLTEVKFLGKEEDWAKIEINYGNENLTNATKLYDN